MGRGSGGGGDDHDDFDDFDGGWFWTFPAGGITKIKQVQIRGEGGPHFGNFVRM